MIFLSLLWLTIIPQIVLSTPVYPLNNSLNFSEFSIVFISDIHYAHYVGEEDYLKRLKYAVEYINEHCQEENIQLVGVLGDIAWTNIKYIQEAKDQLDKLNIPYAPVIGNNEVNKGENGEINFYTVYKTHFQYLAGIFQGWEKTHVPVQDPYTGKEIYLQNYAFNFKGLRIICADWNNRVAKNVSRLTSSKFI